MIVVSDQIYTGSRTNNDPTWISLSNQNSQVVFLFLSLFLIVTFLSSPALLSCPLCMSDGVSGTVPISASTQLPIPHLKEIGQ